MKQSFQQHLEEWVIKLRSHKQTLNTISDEDFLRQSNIETVKWVMGVIEGQRVVGDALLNAQDIGYNSAIDDLISELNKSIEDHA